MKILLVILLTITYCSTISGQFVAKMEVKEPIQGICDGNEVYALIPSFDGQVEALCPAQRSAPLLEFQLLM